MLKTIKNIYISQNKIQFSKLIEIGRLKINPSS